LYNAAKRGPATAVHQLIDSSTPLDEQNICGVMPLWIIASYGHKAVVQVLLTTDAVNINVRSVDGQTPLFQAAANGHSKVVNLLLNYSAKQNHTDKDGRSPVSVAQLYNQTHVVYILAEHAVREH
ncbi:ankyrin repeat-containing domain protein, partial [Cladorrhinum sp. PSN332]